MKPETYDIGVQWQGYRKESPDECAARTLKLLTGLRQLDPCFNIFEKSIRRRGKIVDEPLLLELDELSKLFAKGVNRRDTDRSIIQELGFSLYATTPGEGGAWLRIHCGVYDSPSNRSSCWLMLSAKNPETPRLSTEPMLLAILQQMVEAFAPDFGNASPYIGWEEVNGYPLKERPIGWIMYFSREWATVPPLPAPVRIDRFEDKGTFIILTPERLDISNPAHIELGRTVKKLLSKAGLLDWRTPKQPTI